MACLANIKLNLNRSERERERENFFLKGSEKPRSLQLSFYD
jgi:hypothetical protein